MSSVSSTAFGRTWRHVPDRREQRGRHREPLAPASVGRRRDRRRHRVTVDSRPPVPPTPTVSPTPRRPRRLTPTISTTPSAAATSTTRRRRQTRDRERGGGEYPECRAAIVADPRHSRRPGSPPFSNVGRRSWRASSPASAPTTIRRRHGKSRMRSSSCGRASRRPAAARTRSVARPTPAPTRTCGAPTSDSPRSVPPSRAAAAARSPIVTARASPPAWSASAGRSSIKRSRCTTTSRRRIRRRHGRSTGVSRRSARTP